MTSGGIHIRPEDLELAIANKLKSQEAFDNRISDIETALEQMIAGELHKDRYDIVCGMLEKMSYGRISQGTFFATLVSDIYFSPTLNSAAPFFSAGSKLGEREQITNHNFAKRWVMGFGQSMNLSVGEELERILSRIEESVQKTAYRYRYDNDDAFRQAEIDRRNAEYDNRQKEGRQKILTILLILGTVSFLTLAIYNEWGITWSLG